MSTTIRETSAVREGQGGKILWVKESHYWQFACRVREPTVCRHLSQFAGAPGSVACLTRFASATVGISAGIPGRSGRSRRWYRSAPDPEDSQIGADWLCVMTL